MQLWSRMVQYQSQPPQSQQQPPAPVTGLATGLRPHYFVPPRASPSSVSSILSGKHTHTYPSPPSSPKLGPASFASPKEVPTPQQALLATMASETLLQRLGSAFWQAFTADAPSTETTPDARVPTWDADKIRRVLEGKAVIRVVDVVPEEKVRAASISVSAKTPPDEAKTRESSKECCVTSVLEDSIRALSLGRE